MLLEDLHDGQERVKDEARRFNVVCCGRRWGKTILGLDVLMDAALDGLPAGWFAPTYKLLDEPWKYARHVLSEAIAEKSETAKQITLINGGVLDFWTLDDPDAGRGRKYARVVVDEAAKARHLEEAWTRAIYPTLVDLKGDAWFFSTPRGRDFFWRLHCLGMDPEQADWAAWTMPTSTNEHIDPEEIEAARVQLPERSYQQEFLATFLDDGGGIFRGVAAAVDTGRRESEPRQYGMTYTAGADLARKEDFTVVTVMDAMGRQVYFERFNVINWERQVAAIQRASERYGATVLLDATGVGDPVWEMVRKAGVPCRPYVFTSASKEAAVDNLAMMIEGGRCRLMDIPEQTAELQAFQYELTPSRNIRMGAPSGFHDDTCIALALAAWGVGRIRPLEVF